MYGVGVVISSMIKSSVVIVRMMVMLMSLKKLGWANVGGVMIVLPFF